MRTYPATDGPMKGISSFVSCLFTLASFVRLGHFSVSFLPAAISLPMSSPVHRADDDNLLFLLATCLLASSRTDG